MFPLFSKDSPLSVFFFFFNIVLKIYVYKCFACVHGCTPYACLVPVKVRRHQTSLEVGLKMVVNTPVSAGKRTLLISCKSNKCSEPRHLSITTLPHQPRNNPLCKKFTNKQTKTKGPHYYQVQLFPRWVAHAFNASAEKQKQVDLLVPSLVYIARPRTDGAT